MEPGAAQMQWYVARVFRGRESAASIFLREVGVEVYFPVRTTRYRIRGRNVDRARPVERGFIFVAGPIPDLRTDYWRMRGLNGLMTYSNSAGDRIPCPINISEIHDIRERELAGEWDGVKRAIAKAKRKRYERRWRPLNELAAVVENVAQEERAA